MLFRCLDYHYNFMKKKMFKVINRISKLFDILDWNQIQKENKKKLIFVVTAISVLVISGIIISF